LILLRRSLKVKIDGGKMRLGDRIVDLAMCGEGELSLNWYGYGKLEKREREKGGSTSIKREF